jgi:hypothetical protein
VPLARKVLALASLGAALAAASAASAAAPRVDSLTGAEIIPVSSVRGTFVGYAKGDLPALWRATILHRPLSTGPTVAVTGGTFTIVPTSGTLLRGTVTGGSVAVANPGRGCTNQSYRVSVALSIGSFDGTLTHYRHSLLGQCLVYAATISGRGVF